MTHPRSDDDDRLSTGIAMAVASLPLLALTGAAVAMEARLRVPMNCTWKPARLRGGARSPSSLIWIVVHCTESDAGGALGVANYFQSESSGGSTQLVVGEDGCYRCVGDLETPAGAPGANDRGLHIEIVGRASWTREQWLSRARTLGLASRAIAEWARTYRIPIRYVNAQGLKQGVPGVTTHADVSVAFKKSDHMDPGKNFPLEHVLTDASAMV